MWRAGFRKTLRPREGIHECFPFFGCSAVVLRKHQPSSYVFRSLLFEQVLPTSSNG